MLLRVRPPEVRDAEAETRLVLSLALLVAITATTAIFIERSSKGRVR
ncbi:hypothetical protein AB0A63_08890 [Lentzea sp. NPDC042327]